MTRKSDHAFSVSAGAGSRKGNSMHIGSVIRQQMEEQGRSVSWLSREYGCSRVNMYKIFEKQSIDTQSLLRFSVILHYDFFLLYQEELRQRLLIPKAQE